jgi:anti-sigma28 factor (negative regulator of flagellin synthesis)
MSIRSIGSPAGAQRPVAPAAPAAPAAPTESAAAKQKAAPKPGGPPAHAPAHGYRARQDSVTISNDARTLAAGGPDASQGARAPLTAERVDELRKKVLEGAYDQAHVVDQVAKRLLASGDV